VRVVLCVIFTSTRYTVYCLCQTVLFVTVYCAVFLAFTVSLCTVGGVEADSLGLLLKRVEYYA